MDLNIRDQQVTMCSAVFLAGLQSRFPSSVYTKGSGESLAWAKDNLWVYVMPYLQGVYSLYFIYRNSMVVKKYN